MSEEGVYTGDMTTMRYDDRDVEALFSGGTPGNEGLAQLVPFLRSMREHWLAIPSEDAVERFAAVAAAEVLLSKPSADPAALETASRWDLGPGLRHRLAGAAAAVVFLSGMTGVAAASNGAAPGDTLYGLDRALERVGVGTGGARERLLEAHELLDRGEVSEALAHAVEALEGHTDEETASSAMEALTGAADRVRSGGEDDGDSSEIREAVAGMLSEMAQWVGAGQFDGREFGKRVSEMAGLIGSARGETPAGEEPAGGRPGETPGGPPEGTPGPPQGTPGGPPQGNPGQPSGAGRP